MEAPPEDPSNSDPPISLPPNRPHPTEHIDDFLSRLRPYRTKRSTAGPWIHISGPLQPPRPDKETLVREGKRLLRAYEDEAAVLSANDSTCDLGPLRENLERQIFALARHTGVVSGKWVLIVSPVVVDRCWRLVARATAEGELGFEARALTDPEDGKGMRGGTRSIAVCTRDYADREDVERVLGKLVELGLVSVQGRQTRYVCDAYVYLGIMSGNLYWLKVNLFSSSSMLKR